MEEEYKVIRCNVCGKRFMVPKASGSICCSWCVRDRKKIQNRPFTKDTVFFVCKWYGEGMTVKRIADVLNRSVENVEMALEMGGVKK